MEECLGTGTDVSQGCTFRETASAHALQQRFCHHPQCTVELNVGINAVNGPGMDTFSSGTATGNPLKCWRIFFLARGRSSM